MPLMHVPWRPQGRLQMASLQSLWVALPSLPKPIRHSHTPLLQAPCPWQSLPVSSQPGQCWTSQPSPPYILSHRHLPVSVLHVPWPLHWPPSPQTAEVPTARCASFSRSKPVDAAPKKLPSVAMASPPCGLGCWRPPATESMASGLPATLTVTPACSSLRPAPATRRLRPPVSSSDAGGAAALGFRPSSSSSAPMPTTMRPLSDLRSAAWAPGAK
mmetsp:Transcript_31274/g.79643  ORF Transcript_31274/g.79643 Transcript_31274/m.79643 type:complete len:215 (+) Transcript_31274:731-1375(+)